MYSKGEERDALAYASRSVSDLKFKRTKNFDFNN
jgi:hypothetical protein